MTFEAHPVTKGRWQDLVELFDRPIVRTCFCMFYRKSGDTGAGSANRKAMKALVDDGTVPGLIGYVDGVPVAWVSLGPREGYADGVLSLSVKDGDPGDVIDGGPGVDRFDADSTDSWVNAEIGPEICNAC